MAQFKVQLRKEIAGQIDITAKNEDEIEEAVEEWRAANDYDLDDLVEVTTDGDWEVEDWEEL